MIPTGKVFVKDLVWDKILSVAVDEIDDGYRNLVDYPVMTPIFCNNCFSAKGVNP